MNVRNNLSVFTTWSLLSLMTIGCSASSEKVHLSLSADSSQSKAIVVSCTSHGRDVPLEIKTTELNEKSTRWEFTPVGYDGVTVRLLSQENTCKFDLSEGGVVLSRTSKLLSSSERKIIIELTK